MNSTNNVAAPLLQSLERDQLIQLVEELREEKRMRDAFAHISETGSHDAALMWQGRNRFLAENVAPVVIKPRPEKSFPQNTGGEHRIIDGENLAVMRSLLSDFRGGPKSGFDVIYIDPPYNTGSDTFVYNDNYRFTRAEVERLKNSIGRVEKGVSLDDPSRHTKWINHIAPRLWAARKLLKHTGVVIVSIDEHELPRLWMLLEEMFGESNRIATIVWERSRKNDAKYISEGHEYMLVWARDKNALDEKVKRLAKTPEWEGSKGRWRKRKEGADEILTAYAEAKLEHGDDLKQIQKVMAQFFRDLPKGHPAKKINYRKIDEQGVYRDTGDISWPGGGGPRYEVLHPITGKPCQIPSRGWGYSEESMKDLIAKGKVSFGATHKKVPSLIYRLDEMESQVQTSVVQRDGRNATDVIEALLGKNEFQNPKDHEMLAELFNLVTWRDPNALIFDPYAGSGTTGHAVLAMNAEDGGQRRFVLVENGDPTNKKIPRDQYTDVLTAERVRRVISGRWADGSERPALETGFTFYEARKSVNKKMIMESTRENLADIILQIVEEDSNRIDCRMDGYSYLIGKTRLGFGIALVWGEGKNQPYQPLTREIRSQVMAEAQQANVTKPVYIYAVANASPQNDELYRFQQIPDSILARLSPLEEEEVE